MSVVWTEDQKKVIDTREKNLLVSAAAGSGKTAVLVERILSLAAGRSFAHLWYFIPALMVHTVGLLLGL